MEDNLFDSIEKKTSGPFVETIYLLRTSCEFNIKENIFKVSKTEEKEVLDFLAMEFDEEKTYCSDINLLFDSKAALWASMIVYYSGQLVFYRENSIKDIEEMLPSFNIDYTPSAVLSADLCLRFLPDIIDKLKSINSDDKIIPILENFLRKYHYSGIGHSLDLIDENFENYFNHPALKLMYLSKVVKTKDTKLAQNNLLKQELKNYMGNYKTEIWPQL